MKYNPDYMYGSTAPQLQPQPQKEERHVKKTPSTRKLAVVQPEPVIYPMAKMVLCLLIAFGILSTLIFRFAIITEMNIQMAALNEELEELKDGNRKLQAEISTSINQENIRQIAEERLHMKMPDSYQRIPVKVPKVNYSQVTEQTGEEEMTLLSFFKTLLQ